MGRETLLCPWIYVHTIWYPPCHPSIRDSLFWTLWILKSSLWFWQYLTLRECSCQVYLLLQKQTDAMCSIYLQHSFVWKVKVFVAQSYLTLCDPMDCSQPGFSVHGNCPGKNTGVGCHALLQGIFLTQGSNPGLLHIWKTKESRGKRFSLGGGKGAQSHTWCALW